VPLKCNGVKSLLLTDESFYRWLDARSWNI